MKPATIDPRMTVDEIMRRWPITIRVMMRNEMLCIGCPIGIFHTVSDACEAYRVDRESLVKELLQAITGDPAANGPSAFETSGVAAHPERRSGGIFRTL